MSRDDILCAFIQKTVPFLVQKGKDDLLPRIASHLDKHPDARAKLPDNVKNMMASIRILTEKKAPDLMLKAPVRTQKGECQLCEDALIDLANKYKWLTKHNARVIAISGDTTEQGFEKKLAYHQWPDNYCDFTGMGGTNFKNYGVLGVPTLFLLNRKGIIIEKTAMVNDLLKTLETR